MASLLERMNEVKATDSDQLQAYGPITGRRKLPWRYRWPDSVRDDVLARLLALNAERYAEEVGMGLLSKRAKQVAKAGAGGERRGRKPNVSQAGETEAQQVEQIGFGLGGALRSRSAAAISSTVSLRLSDPIR